MCIARAPRRRAGVDLEPQTLTLPTGRAVSFPIDPFSKSCLLNGTDELGYLLSFEREIAAFEAAERSRSGCMTHPDLRHHAQGRHAARGDLAVGRRQDPHRAPPRRAGVRLHRGRLARLESKGRRVLRARPRCAVADRGDRGVRLDLPGAGQPGRATPTSRRCSTRTRPSAPSSARPGRCTSPMCCERRSTTTCASSKRAWRICGPRAGA